MLIEGGPNVNEVSWLSNHGRPAPRSTDMLRALIEYPEGLSGLEAGSLGEWTQALEIRL